MVNDGVAKYDKFLDHINQLLEVNGSLNFKHSHTTHNGRGLQSRNKQLRMEKKRLRVYLVRDSKQQFSLFKH